MKDTGNFSALMHIIANLGEMVFLSLMLICLAIGIIMLCMKGKRKVGGWIIGSGITLGIIGLAIPGVTILLMKGAGIPDETPVASSLSQAPEGTDFASLPKTPLGPVPHCFAFQDCSVTMVPPPSFYMQQTEDLNGSNYYLTRESRADGTAPSLIISTVLPAEDEESLDRQTVIDAALSSFKESLASYKQEPVKEFVLNGHTFNGSVFTGTAEDKAAVKGFIFATYIKGGYLLLLGEDSLSHFDETMKNCMKSLATCQLKQ